TIELTGAGAGILIPLDLDPAVLQFADKRGFYYLILILVIGSMLLVHALENSRFGAWLTAIRENEDSAQALGVDTFRCKLGAITLSAAMMGLGGVFYAQLFLYLDAGIAYGPWISVEALLVPIIGGLGTVFGPILGSFVVHGLGESAKSLTDGAPGLSLVLYGILLILILRFLPSGLLGLLKSSWGKLSARRNPNDSASTSSQAQEAGDD
ncbi:MAG: branched-chain amino acid ABC transporter permease, partial [Pseudomonadota bacterium]